MSAQSKDGREPGFAAEASAPLAPASPTPAPAPGATPAGPDSPAPSPGPGPSAAAPAPPPPPPPPPAGAGEDEDADPSALREAAEEGRAPPAPGAPQPGPAPPAPAQLVQKAHELMWYVLVKEQRRLVIWFPDMVKDVIGSYRKWCRSIVRRSSLVLARVFGLHLRLTSLHTMEFALVRARAPDEPEPARTALGGRMPMAGLLLMILSLIYVKGRGARESAVWNVLRILGLRPWKKHPTFGEVRRLITEDFVQQNYLKYQRVPHVEPPEFEFLWGARASREITKMQIMEFLSRVFKKDPQAWPSRYREALEEARALREAELAAHYPRATVPED